MEDWIRSNAAGNLFRAGANTKIGRCLLQQHSADQLIENHILQTQRINEIGVEIRAELCGHPAPFTLGFSCKHRLRDVIPVDAGNLICSDKKTETTTEAENGQHKNNDSNQNFESKILRLVA